jgi:hypothetical protein
MKTREEFRVLLEVDSRIEQIKGSDFRLLERFNKIVLK